jgi:hypothetical protein
VVDSFADSSGPKGRRPSRRTCSPFGPFVFIGPRVEPEIKRGPQRRDPRKGIELAPAKIAADTFPSQARNEENYGDKKAAPRKRARNPFPGEYFFVVPIMLYDCGLVRAMGPSEVVRYMTLLRIANFRYGEKVFQITEADLRHRDGIAERTARRIHAKLQERGLIQIVNTKPFTYSLIHPLDWPQPIRVGDPNRPKWPLTGSPTRVPKRPNLLV